MSRFYLVRHGTVDRMNEVLHGRTATIHLNQDGRAQAERVAEALSRARLEAVYSSPLERAQETTEIICRVTGLPLEIEPAFNEVNFGRWTSRRFADLQSEPEWQRFNSNRSRAGAPGGESMLEAQLRAVSALEALRFKHNVIAVVTHGDIIRAVTLHYLGVHLDLIHRLRIDTGSITVLELDHCGVQFTLINGHSLSR